MNELRIYRSRLRRTVWQLPGLLLACLLLSAGLFVAACGDGSSDTDTTAAPTIGDAVSSTIEADSMDSDELANAIRATYAEAMQELNALLADKPEAATVKSDVEQLKEHYVQKLVELGWKKEALDITERAEVDAILMTDLIAMSEEPWYAAYSDIYSHYSTGDLDFSNLVASFNIITQYADFELLRKQEPEEATRLGIP